jgi:hypothetical protein
MSDPDSTLASHCHGGDAQGAEQAPHGHASTSTADAALAFSDYECAGVPDQWRLVFSRRAPSGERFIIKLIWSRRLAQLSWACDGHVAEALVEIATPRLDAQARLIEAQFQTFPPPSAASLKKCGLLPNAIIENAEDVFTAWSEPELALSENADAFPLVDGSRETSFGADALVRLVCAVRSRATSFEKRTYDFNLGYGGAIVVVLTRDNGAIAMAAHYSAV